MNSRLMIAGREGQQTMVAKTDGRRRSAAMTRRLTKHRREAARLREVHQDPEEALSAFVRDRFSQDALAESARQDLDHGSLWDDEVGDQGVNGQGH